MSDPPTFSTLAAELQVMILAKFFEDVKIEVKYPYQSIRDEPYSSLRLQEPLQTLFVSKSFHGAAKTGMYQTATFHFDQFYFGHMARRSTRLLNAVPKAFSHFRHISAPYHVMSEFLHAKDTGRWPFKDLRTVDIVSDTEHPRTFYFIDAALDHGLNDFVSLREYLLEDNTKLRWFLSVRRFPLFTSVPLDFDLTALSPPTQIARLILDGNDVSIKELSDVEEDSWQGLMSILRLHLGDELAFRELAESEGDAIDYENPELEFY